MLRKVLTILTLIVVVFVVWQARTDIASAISYLSNTNLFFVLMLIPEQLLMYYSVGQMFFAYMSSKAKVKATKLDKSRKNVKTTGKGIDKHQKNGILMEDGRRVSPWSLARISFELNFVNHAIPSGGFAGLGYITWRLGQYGSPAGQTSFMYALRYAITIAANQLQTVIAILILILVGGVIDTAWWVIGLTLLVSLGVIGGLVALVIIASSRKRIDWFAGLATRVVNGVVRVVTFGHKRQLLTKENVGKYLDDVFHNLTLARENKRILLRPVLWGILYSFLEIATYWLVGISMGHVEILPQIMIGEALASVIGAVMLTPGGVGGYEGTMIFIMSVLGVDPGLATAVVISTRVVVLLGTIVSGYGFYQNAVSKIGKREREQIMREVGE